MAYKVLDVFGLRDTPKDLAADILRPVVSRLLDLTKQLMPQGGDRSREENFGASHAGLRRRFADAAGLEEIAAIADAALSLCAEQLACHGRECSATGAELTAIIEIVREAMASLAGDEVSYSADVTGSASRLDALRVLSDINEIKKRLLAEVNGLKPSPPTVSRAGAPRSPPSRPASSCSSSSSPSRACRRRSIH